MEKQYLGVMIDVAQHPLKISELKKMIDILAKIGYNAIELYLEDRYEVKEYPYFGYLRGRYSKDELRDLDNYALTKGVEIIPNMQTLAHLSYFSKNAANGNLWDTTGILLVGEEETYKFIECCIASLRECFSSNHLNIGMDEAHTLGLGKYLEKNGYVNRTEILLQHLERVAKISEKYNFIPHMWSDMFFRPYCPGYYGRNIHISKDVINRIPNNVGLTYWDYYTMDDETYHDMFQAHLETGKEIWFAGGAWGWDGFAPYNNYSQLTLKPAVINAKKFNIKNYLITLWGDGECSYYSLLPTLYAFKQYVDGIYDQEIIKQGFEKMFGFPYDNLVLLDIPNITPKYEFGKSWPKNPCKCLLYADPFLGLFDYDLKSEGTIPYLEYEKKLRLASRDAGEFGYILLMMAALCNLLSIKAELGIRTRAAYKSKRKSDLVEVINSYSECIKRTKSFYKKYYDLWHRENLSIGWEVHDLRLGALERRLKTCKNRLEEFLNGKIDRIEELEEEVLTTTIPETLCNNSYLNIVTRRNI